MAGVTTFERLAISRENQERDLHRAAVFEAQAAALSKEGLLDVVRALNSWRVKDIEGPGIRILVAEDHPIILDGIVAILSNSKDIVVVGQARDGAEAIELIKRFQPDIALLDLRMPVVDGVGVVRWVKRSGSKTRTVILTIFSGERDVSEAMKAGADAYLLKDASTRGILKTIRHVHRGEPHISSQQRHGFTSKESSAELKPVELDILTLIVQGHDNRTIGSRLGLATDAVKYHLRGVFSKLGVRKRAAAARKAIERGLVVAD